MLSRAIRRQFQSCRSDDTSMTDGVSLEDLISRQKPGFSLERPFYTDDGIFERDLAAIIARQWLYVDHASRLPEAGDFLVYGVAGEEIILVRGEDGEVRAFYNVCRHRGSRFCLESAGNARSFSCPYHGWTYALDGRLTAARRMPDAEIDDVQRPC